MKSVLRRWLERLADLEAEASVVLPFSIDDEYVYAFRAAKLGDRVALRCVDLDVIGYDHGVDNTVTTMFDATHVAHEREGTFGTFVIQDIAEGIRQFVGP